MPHPDVPTDTQPVQPEQPALAESAHKASTATDRLIRARWCPETRHDPPQGLEFVLETFGNATVVAIPPDQTGISARWLERKSNADVIAWAEERSAVGHNLYFTPNLPVARLARKPSKGDIIALRALFGDVDAKSGRSLSKALAVIDDLPMPPPSVIIATGGGFQPIWLLNKPIPANPEAVTRLEELGRQLARLADGDPVQNVDRILRLPFTMNYPNAKKRAAGRGISCSGLVQP